MGEQVADRDGRRRELILESKAGIDVADAAVPRDLAVAHQRRHDSRGQRLGERGELEHRVGVNGFGLANLANAEGAEKDDFIAMDDGDREPRYELSVDDLPRELLEFGQRRGDLLLGRGLRQGRQGNEHGRDTGKKGPPRWSTHMSAVLPF